MSSTALQLCAVVLLLMASNVTVDLATCEAILASPAFAVLRALNPLLADVSALTSYVGAHYAWWAHVAWSWTPTANDILLVLGLCCYYYYLKVRKLNPYTFEAARLLLAAKDPACICLVAWVYQYVWKYGRAVLYAALTCSGVVDWTSDIRRLLLIQSLVPLPSVWMQLGLFWAVHYLSFFIFMGLFPRFPTEGVPLDMRHFEETGLPCFLDYLEVKDYISMSNVLRLRAVGVDPEMWRLGKRPLAYRDMEHYRW